VSWPLASFVIVTVILGLGWLAYERRRPSARVAAVVAVMAALAALGRDAFAALPDVKPITAMTLVVGYSLGPLPGFTVGALGMLVSNFMLGQGPYTPWQMAAWGCVGLLGAAFGALGRRRLGRFALACTCAVAALAAKEVMNVYTWTLGASHTPAAFLAVAGTALAYDVTDVVASFLFGLAFAPELARVLERVRMRMDVSWEPLDAMPGSPGADAQGGGATPALGRAVSAVLAAAVVSGIAIGGVSAARAAAPTSRASTVASTAVASTARLQISREVAFLARAQNADGGFGGAPGQTSSELYSAWAAIGLAAAGRNPLSLRRDGHTVLDALRGEAGELHGIGDVERTILALHACGASVHSLAGRDPVATLLRARAPDGSFGHLANLTAFAVFALRSAGYPPTSAVLRSAGRWLLRQQEAGGGFGFATKGAGSDIDDTAAVVQAVLDTGVRAHAASARAIAFLERAQSLDGGYPQQAGGLSNAQSTAWAIQALSAAGRDPATLTRDGSRSPLAYLASLLAPDGSVRYSRTGSQTPVWVTAQALTALARRPFPIGPPRARTAAAGAPAHVTPAAVAPAPAARPAPARTAGADVAQRTAAAVARALAALIGALHASVLGLSVSAAL